MDTHRATHADAVIYFMLVYHGPKHMSSLFMHKHSTRHLGLIILFRARGIQLCGSGCVRNDWPAECTV